VNQCFNGVKARKMSVGKKMGVAKFLFLHLSSILLNKATTEIVSSIMAEFKKFVQNFMDRHKVMPVFSRTNNNGVNISHDVKL
jgi:hypothetical protein